MTINYISQNSRDFAQLAKVMSSHHAAVCSHECDFQQIELRNTNDGKMSRKRKAGGDGRLSQKRWEGEQVFVLQGQKPVCRVCYVMVSVNYRSKLLPLYTN